MADTEVLEGGETVGDALAVAVGEADKLGVIECVVEILNVELAMPETLGVVEDVPVMLDDCDVEPEGELEGVAEDEGEGEGNGSATSTCTGATTKDE